MTMMIIIRVIPLLLTIWVLAVDACYKLRDESSTAAAAAVSARQNPCLKKECHLGAECQLSYDGQTAECVCVEKCHNYGDSRGSRRVCGTDGRDYPNLCELNRQACEFSKEIHVRYNGSCDPCYGVKCPAAQTCQVDDNRNPICKCNAACGKEFEPVCGSDGRTYINECILRVEACRMRKSLRILHQKACAENNACRVLKCSHYQDCEINRYGIATCQCPFICSKVLKPVCGTDGETYDSECDLKRQACINHRNVTVRYMGPCDLDNFCHRNHGICKYGSVCGLSRAGNYTCQCPECSEEYAPVCGNNGITYTNVCKFRRDMCEKRRSNVTFSDGPCPGCENVNCLHYSHCETDPEAIGGGRCVCPTECGNEKPYDPVCGSDLVTYANECELRVTACRNRQPVVVIKRGPCHSCQGVQCEFGARCENGRCECPKRCPAHIEPVCGSNNVTYENQCQLMISSCSSARKIDVQYKGPCESPSSMLAINSKDPSESLMVPCAQNACKYGGVCIVLDEQSGRQQCFCNFNCSMFANHQPAGKLCGSDGRIYDSECAFREEQCIRQQDIRRMDMIFCKKFLNIPCQGEPPMVNPITGHEYDCRLHGGNHCPRGSYCHRGPDFGKCCRELDYNDDDDDDDDDGKKDCHDTTYGCCPDQRTPAPAANQNGCPARCQCNRLGSYLDKCDPKTGQCYCKPGVSGLRCDRCEATYWGLHKISEGNAGCIPCQCNKIGSSRNDCEQMTGRCVCRPGFHGMKCDICPNVGNDDNDIGQCPIVEPEVQTGTNSSRRCQDHGQCQFDATCHNGNCVCDFQCPFSSMPVCGDDGQIYESDCHRKLFSCQERRKITTIPAEQCYPTTVMDSATTSPVRRSTRYQNNYEKLTRDRQDQDRESSPSRPTLPSVDYYDGGAPDEAIHFDGRSLIQMETMKAHAKILIYLEMIPFSPDGIVLYNGQTTTGEGDYIAVLLRNGHVELRFNLGSGSVVLKSTKPVTLGRLTSVEVNRQFSEASLTVNVDDQVIGKSEGPHKLLDLGQNLYIGGLPGGSGGVGSNKVLADTLATKKNFTGCLHSLTINREKISLMENGQHEAIWTNVGTCDREACSRSFCLNGGRCRQRSAHWFRCQCAAEFGGQQCQSRICSGHQCTFCRFDQLLCNQSLTVPVLDFWNQSFLQLPTLQGVSQSFVIELWLMTRAANGLVMLNKHSQGDFLELHLRHGHVHFDFNLGNRQNKTGMVSLRSGQPITTGEWHRIVMSRQSKIGILQVDDQPIVTGTATGNLNELNLDQPLFLGGLSVTEQEHSFNGAIQRLVVNAVIQKNLVERAIELVNVQPYQGPPCGFQNPCLNRGQCLPRLNQFICRCEANFHGELCELTIDPTGSILRRFAHNDTVTSHELQSVNYQRNSIELKFRTKSNNGLILWLGNGPDSETVADYIAVLLVDGFLEFSFNLGKQTQYLGIRTPVRVNDGDQHQALLQRHQRIGTVDLDDRWMVSAVSEVGATELNTDAKLWIGGGAGQLPNGLPAAYYQNFAGCLEYLRIDGITIVNSVKNLFECSLN